MKINPYSTTSATDTDTTKNLGSRFDPSKFLDKIANKLFKKQDADGDSDLDNSELPGLSQEAFSKLDTDGDGKVTKDEVKSALQKQLDAIKNAFETGGRDGVKSYLDSIKGTADGELLQTLAPRLHHRFGHAQPAAQPDANTTSTTTSSATTGTTNSLNLLA